MAGYAAHRFLEVGLTALGNPILANHRQALDGVFDDARYEHAGTLGEQGDCYLNLTRDDIGDSFVITMMLGNGTSEVVEPGG